MVFALKRHSRLREDLQDIAVVAERRDGKPVAAGDIKEQLHKHGLLQ